MTENSLKYDIIVIGAAHAPEKLKKNYLWEKADP